MKKVYMVTDLGPGDGGKGGVVHKLSHLRSAHTIVKVGGAQGSHGVRTAQGQSFNFSQFGCGTFEGVRTHLSPRIVIDPVGILNEAKALRYEAGVYNPHAMLTIDYRALCNTPLHGIASRVKEMALRDNPRGTIGTGVGQAARLALTNPELSIFAKDMLSPLLRSKLFALQGWLQQHLTPFFEQEFLAEDRERVAEEKILLYDNKFVDWIYDQFQTVAALCAITDETYFTETILGKEGVIVVESSHGILTDTYTGFHPHTSALRTLPKFTRAMFTDAGYDGEIVSLGIHRAYQIRHGAGPMVTSDSSMTEQLLPGSHKEENRYQGKIRVGPIDLVALRYALSACGEGAFDGLAITWFDQVQKLGTWNYCNRYNITDDAFFTKDGDIKVRKREDAGQLEHLAGLTKVLEACTPQVETMKLPNGASQDELYALCADILLEKLGVPVRMISFGPTERDKVCK